MDIRVRKMNSSIHIIHVKGEMDMYNSHELKQQVLKMIENGVKGFILDLGDLQYIDSSGISVLIFIYSTLQKNKLRLWFVNVHGSVERVIELTKLNQFFPIAGTLDDLLGQFRKTSVVTEKQQKQEKTSPGIKVNSDSKLFDKTGMSAVEFPSDYQKIRYYTSLIVQKAPAEIKEVNILEQQISEIIKNAIKHGNKKDKSKKVKVLFSFSKNHAHLIVSDKGKGFQQIDEWNRFYRKRSECFTKRDFEEMQKYLTFRTPNSDEQDGGNALFAAVEYWNEGVVFNDRRNSVALRRSF